jgi:hypothetical protein
MGYFILENFGGMIHALLSLHLLSATPVAIPPATRPDTYIITTHRRTQRAARRANRSATWWIGWVAWTVALVLFSAAVSWWLFPAFAAFIGSIFIGGWLRTQFRRVRRMMGCVVICTHFKQ